METEQDRGEWTPTRRAILASTGAGTVATGGCVQRARSLVNRDAPRQVSLTIKTVPADADEAATKTARMLASNLEAAGIEASVTLMAEDELRRDVLLNHDYDLYVARYPDRHDPDFLRPLLHSVFAGEPGWQNPFGFANLSVDELLVEQRRREGVARQNVAFELQRRVARHQPFAVVCVPDEIRTVRTGRFVGWSGFDSGSPLNFLALRRRASATAGAGENVPAGADELRVVITDHRVTENFNPIAVEFRNRGTFTGLLYDALGRRYDGGIRPWLAESWVWDESTEDGTVATVRLRDGHAWHDGRPLAADDVEFTYRFLADTTLGDGERPIPAPRFRGRISIVESVEAVDGRTLRFAFGDTSPVVAARAFTVPVLPRHEWEPKATEVEIAGLDLFDGVTEALVWPNPEPVGSGPLRFERSIPEEALVLSRYDGHFLGPDASGHPADRLGGVPFETLSARVAPSDDAAVELVAAGEADATAASVDSTVVPDVGRHDSLQLVVTRSSSFYHVGFNVRHEVLGNPRFRRAVARLLDKQHVVETVFDGYATAAATPLSETTWTPTDLRWRGRDPEVPFAGTDGELSVPAAREVFREAGYQYDEGGRLVNR